MLGSAFNSKIVLLSPSFLANSYNELIEVIHSIKDEGQIHIKAQTALQGETVFNAYALLIIL